MAQQENHREHYNLYYIFKADKREHPMPPRKVYEIKKKMFEKFTKKIKPINDAIPPC